MRRIRIFSRLGEHSSTSEPLAGLEGSLAWVPSGEILASTQRRTFSRAQTDPAGQNPGATTEEEEQLQVVFFERNGLRRHDFEMRELRAQRVQVWGMRWNAASDLLALWVQRDGEAGQAEHEGAFAPHAYLGL